MTILWCGMEDIDFNGINVSSNTGLAKDTNMARSGIQGTGISSAFTPVTSCWLSGNVHILTASTSFKTIGLVKDATTLDGIWFGIGTPAYHGVIFKYSGTTLTMLAQETDTSFTYNSLVKMDMKIQDYGANGTVKVYANGGEIISYSGDISVAGVSSLSAVAQVSTLYVNGMTEIIVADEDTRLMRLKVLVPNANGDVNEFSGAYTNIDEVTMDDADTIYTATDAQSFQCNLTGMPNGNFIVKAVKVAARATDGVGGMGLKIGIKTNNTVDLSDAITLGGYWETVERMYQQNPITSNLFSPEEIEALQLAFKSAAV